MQLHRQSSCAIGIMEKRVCVQAMISRNAKNFRIAKDDPRLNLKKVMKTMSEYKDRIVKTSDFKIIKRMSTDGKVYLAKNYAGNHVVVQQGKVIGVFQYYKDANKIYTNLCNEIDGIKE